MKKFDVFVRGVIPERHHEMDQIKTQVGRLFNLQGDQLEALFGGKQDVCVKKGTAEQDAMQYQKVLTQLGMICVYKPAKIATQLSLEPIEETKDGVEKIICPICKFTNRASLGHDMERCVRCGLQFEKYERLQKENKEKLLIKERLIKKKTLRESEAKKMQIKQREEEAKRILEKEVEKELGLNKKYSFYWNKFKQLSKPAQTGTVLLAVLGGGGIGLGAYYYIAYGLTSIQKAEPEPNKTIVIDPEKILSDIKLQKTPQAILSKSENKKTSDVLDSEKHLAQKQLSDDNAKHSEAGSKKEDKIAALEEKQKQLARNAEMTRELLPVLMAYQAYDKEWMDFMERGFQSLLIQHQFYRAYQMALHMPIMEKQIDDVGALGLVYKSRGNVQIVDTLLIGLEKNINRYPSLDQLVYKARLAKYRYLIYGREAFLENLYQQFLALDNKVERFLGEMLLALYFSQTGLTEQARVALQQAGQEVLSVNELRKIDWFALINASSADYRDKQQIADILQFMEQKIKLLPGSLYKDKALLALFDTLVHLEIQHDMDNVILTMVSSPEMRLLAYLRQIVNLAQKNEFEGIWRLLEKLSYLPYQAMGNAVAAIYLQQADDKTMNRLGRRLSILADKQLATILQPANRALSIAWIARFYARTGRIKQAEHGFDQALVQLSGISNDYPEKDIMLKAVAVEALRGGVLDKAREVTEKISSQKLLDNSTEQINAMQAFMSFK